MQKIEKSIQHTVLIEDKIYFIIRKLSKKTYLTHDESHPL